MALAGVKLPRKDLESYESQSAEILPFISINLSDIRYSLLGDIKQ